MLRFRTLPFLAFFVAVAQSAHANEFMFSEATALVVVPLMLLWAIAGVAGAILLRRRGVRLDHVGVGAFACAGFFTFLGFHFELVASFWMIYLALSTVYYLFRRPNVPAADRRANLVFHGIFLVLVVVGGIVAKVVYYTGMGNYTRFLDSVELYPGWLTLFGIITVVVLGWFYWATVRTSRR